MNWKEAVILCSRYSTSICLERLWQTRKKTCQNWRCPGRDSNQVPPEYKSTACSLHRPVRC